MYNLGADYQIQEKNAHECLEAAQRVAEKLKTDLQTLQSIELLNFLRSKETAGDAGDEGQDNE